MNLLSIAVFLGVFLFAGIGQGAPQYRIFENSLENSRGVKVGCAVERLKNLKPGELAEELSGQFEGDMILTEEQYLDITSRNGMVQEQYRWPDNVVYYEIDDEFFNEDQVEYILRAMRIIESVSCVQYRPRDPENPAFIRIHGDGSGCSATVGHIGTAQNLKLQPYPLDSGCFRLGTIVHELIHGLGFRHMQSTYNRDDYVEIVWDNIKPGSENNFLLYGPDRVSNFGAEYDYGSVMHYSATAFSINGQKTIVALKETNEKMGQRDGMSEKDIFRINRMYNCFKKN